MSASGKLSEKEQFVANKNHGEREDMPASVFLKPGERKYPVKTKQDGGWKYSRDLLLAAARRARMEHDDALAKHADEIRQREFGSTAQDEDITMSLNSRRALIAAGAITAYVRPKLAQDAKFEAAPALEGVTAKNFNASIPTIIERVKKATMGKLALDANPAELQSLLEALQGGGQEGEDEINPANPGLPDQGGMPIHDAEGENGGAAHEFLRGKLSPEDHQKFQQLRGEDAKKRADDARRADDMWKQRADDARKKLGRDESPEEMDAREKKQASADARKHLGRDETAEELKKREERDAQDRKRRADDAKKRADDAAAEAAAAGNDPKNGQRSANDKKVKAMDEATVKLAIDEAVAAERISQRAIQEALIVVRPYVGDLKLAFDSADQVYRKALEMRGETGLDTVHPSAYRRLLEARPLPGVRPSSLPAMDSAASTSALDALSKITPSASKVRIG